MTAPAAKPRSWWRSAAMADGLWWLFWAVLTSVWCLTAATQLSATYDEPVYIKCGLEGWRTFSHQGFMKLGTMPLPPDLQTLPLYLWERCRGVRFDQAVDWDVMLPCARAATLVFWWVLLGYAMLAGRTLAGSWGGRLAVMLLACEPTFLAHACLATTDVAAAACLLALVYHFRTGREGGWWLRRGVPAIWFAAALLAKASALVFAPLCLLVVELERLGRSGAFRGLLQGGWKAAVRQLLALSQGFRRDMAWVVGLGMIGVFLFCGSDWQANPSFVRWAHGLPEGIVKPGLCWLAEHLRIFSNAGEGLLQQVTHNMKGHKTFLLGASTAHAVWYYFPVLLTIKLTVSLFLLAALLAIFGRRAALNWAVLSAAVLLALSPCYRVQIGIRMILPLLTLGIVGLAAAAVQYSRSAPSAWQRRLWSGACGAAAVWALVAALTVWPDGLRYTNELWGGTEEGYRWVCDSNYDWGQGLKELARWRGGQRQDAVDLCYFGTDPASEKLPVRLIALSGETPSDVRGHYLAISASYLFGPSDLYIPELAPFLVMLRQRTPSQRTSTFFIYDFTDQKTPSSAAGHARRSVQALEE